MRKQIIVFSLLLLLAPSLSSASPAEHRLRGRILLQVEENGEAWYVKPEDGERLYMKDGSAAYQLMRNYSLGISNIDLSKIPIGFEDRFDCLDSDGDGLCNKLEDGIGTDKFNKDSDKDGYDDGAEVKGQYNPLGTGKTNIDLTLANRLKGKILLQVEANGEAWYVHPDDGKRYYMPDGPSAYQIMRYLSLGISNDNLAKIDRDNNISGSEDVSEIVYNKNEEQFNNENNNNEENTIDDDQNQLIDEEEDIVDDEPAVTEEIVSLPSDDGNLVTSLVSFNQWGNLLDVTSDDDYIYLTGNTIYQEEQALIMKINKGDLSNINTKVLDGAQRDKFYKIVVDGDFIYAVGEAHAIFEGHMLFAKFDKKNLDLITYNMFNIHTNDKIVDMYLDDDYIYAVGEANPKSGDMGEIKHNAFVLKADKNTLNVQNAKLFEGYSQFDNTTFDKAKAITGDENYLYVLGETRGDKYIKDDKEYSRLVALLTKLKKSDLSIVSNKAFLNDRQAYDQMMDIVSDDNNLYVIGTIASWPKQGGIIMKFNKNDLSVIDSRIYMAYERVDFWDGYIEGGNLYITGRLFLPGGDNGELALAKISANDLSVIKSKRYRPGRGPGGSSIYFDSKIYVVANVAFDTVITKIANLDAGDYSSTPEGHTFLDLDLLESDPELDYFGDANISYTDVVATKYNKYNMYLRDPGLMRESIFISK